MSNATKQTCVTVQFQLCANLVCSGPVVEIFGDHRRANIWLDIVGWFHIDVSSLGLAGVASEAGEAYGL